MLRLNPHPRLDVWPALAAALVFAIAFAAGQWQSRRAAGKDIIEARHATLRDAPAVALPRSLTAPELEALDGRRILAQGEFLNDKTVLLDNQVMNRIVGYHVLTPFRADGGTAVLVNRGWVAAGRTRAELPVIAPVTGVVSIEGRAAIPPQRVYEIKPDAQPGRVWQNLQLPTMSTQLGMDLLPFVLRLASDSGDGLMRVASVPGPSVPGGAGPVAASATSTTNAASATSGAGGSAGHTGMNAAKHRGYAFQWYGLAALTAFLFVFFTFFERTGQHDPSS